MLKLTTFLADAAAATLVMMVLLLTVMTDVGEGREGAAAGAVGADGDGTGRPPKMTGTVLPGLAVSVAVALVGVTADAKAGWVL